MGPKSLKTENTEKNGENHSDFLPRRNFSVNSVLFSLGSLC
jgi:hypothetical protein